MVTSYSRGHKTYYDWNTWYNGTFRESSVGKTVFSPREEAEKALKGNDKF